MSDETIKIKVVREYSEIDDYKPLTHFELLEAMRQIPGNGDKFSYLLGRIIKPGSHLNTEELREYALGVSKHLNDIVDIKLGMDKFLGDKDMVQLLKSLSGIGVEIVVLESEPKSGRLYLRNNTVL